MLVAALLYMVAMALLPIGVSAKMPKFATPGLHTFDAGLANVDGRIAAFGDFNGDRMTDVFILSSDQTTISVYAWDFGDFNYDGMLDFILFGQENPLNKDDTSLHFELFLGNGKKNATEVESSKSISEPSHPFIIDYDGDMRPSLIGHVHSQPDILSVWTFNSTNNIFDVRKTNFSQSTSNNGHHCHLPHPHSSAFIDLDGDCLADVFLMCDDGSGNLSYQIWVNSKKNGFQFARAGGIPKGAGQISFADMDADGTMDMVFPVCNKGQSCTINVAYNHQMGLCRGSLVDRCRDLHNLCVADEYFNFTFDTSSPRYTSMSISDIFPSDDIYVNDLTFKGTMPNPLRIGDYNNDGYPDILLMTVSTAESSKVSARLLRSVPCGERCSHDSSTAGARTFVSVYEGVGAFKNYPEMMISGLTFMDINEDGTLDIFMTARKLNMGMQTLPLLNNYYNDAFFLKAIVLNGVCNEWCPEPVPFPNPKPYGVNYAGGTFKYTVIDTMGQRRATQIAQLPQSAYMSLQTPYALFGLGRTNNYIEDLFIGVSRRAKEHVGAYQGLIPNSQLVIIPYESDGGGQGPADWKLELYMNPSSSSAGLMAVLCGAITMLCILIWGLDWAEKREDELERKRKLHAINFDAL
ncbi:hypothetical protein BASA50_008422 [Batrachochytrium salamandrivorans]|uniref:T-cell immunomodulatory protein TIP C2 domain-containing protein n=1 Tax=Batrachochytrium salamandrivorans TaxID=1357716 RepID=A0ABQ8F494_9FUNG|nr:hypothetical protein BASA61_000436 [Batrachochytrium salamandrivorans]KAH6591908.1 hypothetical protein BASA50_008422 [Batrachochytrium salamandrivorans]